MGNNEKDLKRILVESLFKDSDHKVPTTVFRRLGGTGLAVVKSGLMMASRKRRGDDKEFDIDEDTLASLVNSIGELKGIAMKMGQIMSYIDMAIPDEMQNALSVLQTHAQPMSFERVGELITEQLPENGNSLLKQMEPTPISAASIGQVHRSRLTDGQLVAVKVQYPEIAKAIETDFRPAAIGTKLASLLYPGARIDRFVEEARERFLEECNYKHEARCQRRFHQIYTEHPVLFVPEVHDRYSARRVLTSTFVEGMNFDSFLGTNPSQSQRNRIGEALFEFYIGTLFKHHLYNCDPHPGNYIFCFDGRVAMLDHGCTREFEPGFIAKLVDLTCAVHSDSQRDIHSALLELEMVQEGKNYDYPTIRRFLRSFYGPMLKDENCVVDLGAAISMREVAKAKHKLLKFSLPAEFAFLFRIRFGLMSVLSRLQAKANWYQLEKKYLGGFEG